MQNIFFIIFSSSLFCKLFFFNFFPVLYFVIIFFQLFILQNIFFIIFSSSLFCNSYFFFLTFSSVLYFLTFFFIIFFSCIFFFIFFPSLLVHQQNAVQGAVAARDAALVVAGNLGPKGVATRRVQEDLVRGGEQGPEDAQLGDGVL